MTEAMIVYSITAFILIFGIGIGGRIVIKRSFKRKDEKF
jgi:hypothetical protein